jgi:vacuolar protein sorting-associated protein 52
MPNASIPPASALSLPSTKGAGAAASSTKDDSGTLEDQLSNDLALFLANPSLKAALADGSLDLASYSSTVEEELSELETQCIAKYREKSQDIIKLQTELDDCDRVLLGLQEMLLGFQADLGGLSGDIRQLQETSKTLGVQLKNRRQAESGLRSFLTHVVLSPQLAQAICKGPVNAAFRQAVRDLNQIHLDSHNETPQDWSCGQPPASTVAGKEMQTHVEQLRLVAVSRIREYFLAQMALLRKPQTNIRMIQSHGLLQFADLYDFLAEASPDIAKEVFDTYTSSMSKTLYALFRTYQAQLLQLDATKYAATRQDVLAMEDALMRDTITTKAKKRVDVFTLGDRANQVLQVQQSPITAAVAVSEHKTYPYECLFKSCLMHLVDAVTNEYVFCRQFFKEDAFTNLFTPTLGLLLEQLENYLFGCHDALCILLMIKVTHQFKRLAKSRTITSLDSFLDKMAQLLWPRLNTIMEAHLRSLKQATAEKLGGVELHSHYVSRRFAEFACSILLVLHKGTSTAGGSKDGHVRSGEKKKTAGPSIDSSVARSSAGDVLLQDLNELLNEFVVLLERLSEEHVSNKKKVIFMINNLDQIVCIFQERRVAGKELNKVLELLMAQRELFVEEELLNGFSKMIAFVQQTESHLAADPKNTDVVNAQVVEALVREFASSWRQGIEEINRNVLSYFSNFRNGMEILKQVLTQLLLYYTRFQDVIRKAFKKQPAFCKDLVPTTVILAEIKKYALSI